MEALRDLAELVLGVGLESKEINVAQMGLRAAILYVAVLVIVRLGKKRFMGRATAFDVILGIMLGSIVSRAITGNAPILPAVAAGAVLVGMHWAFSGIALRWHTFGTAIKGRSDLLVRDGTIDEDAMRKTHVTERDLREDLRGQGIDRLKEVAEGRLERSGTLSVIRAKKEPKIVEIGVANGVQTVRLEIA